MKRSVMFACTGLLLAGLVAGCATTAEMTPEEEAQAALMQWKEGVVANDLYAMMMVYSEDFDHYEYGDKEGARLFIGQAIDQGFLMDAEVITEDAEYEVMDDGSVVVYPIDLLAAFGSATIEFVMEPTADGYKIVNMEMTGV